MIIVNKSMIDIYTSKYYPTFRYIGGSMPIIIYSELFCNFHFLSVIAVLLLFFLADKLFLTLIFFVKAGKFNFKVISLLFLYTTFIQFVRGGGLDIYIIYWLLVIPVILIFSYFMRKKTINTLTI